MNKINISFITDDALETLYKNSEEVAEYLIKEKENSNKNYVFNEKKKKKKDFNKIKTSMEKRKAPDAQFAQLEKIYDQYIMYLNYIKYKDYSRGIED